MNMATGPITIGYIPDHHGEVGKCQALEITKAEAERLVRAYLLDIVRIDAQWELGDSTGSWEIRL